MFVMMFRQPLNESLNRCQGGSQIVRQTGDQAELFRKTFLLVSSEDIQFVADPFNRMGKGFELTRPFDRTQRADGVIRFDEPFEPRLELAEQTGNPAGHAK